MNIKDGIYRLVSGDGGGFCVAVRSGKIYPEDPGGEVTGTIRVDQRTFLVNRWDDPFPIEEDGTIKVGGEVFTFKLELPPER